MTLRDQQKMLTRANLLDSALAVFAEKGYGRATVGDIVSGAGASHGTFYLYFPSKASIMVELLETGWAADIAAHLDSLAALADPSQKSLRPWIGEFLAIYERHGGALRAWAQAAAETNLVGHTDSYVRLMMRKVSAAAAVMRSTPPDEVTHHDIDPTTVTLVFELERVCYYRVVRRWEVSDSIVDVLTEQWSQALGGPGAGEDSGTT